MSNINDSILTRRWNERYSQLSDELKNKITLYESNIKQLKKIKRNLKYPDVGDVFNLISCDDIEINGIVINNHINNINGEDLIVIALIKYRYDYKQVIEKGLSSKNLIIAPQIVGKEYWTKGYFNIFDHWYRDINCDSYGFYSIGKGKIFDEYGMAVEKEPNLLGVFGVSTINGISIKINQELIIEGII